LEGEATVGGVAFGSGDGGAVATLAEGEDGAPVGGGEEGGEKTGGDDPREGGAGGRLGEQEEGEDAEGEEAKDGELEVAAEDEAGEAEGEEGDFSGACGGFGEAEGVGENPWDEGAGGDDATEGNPFEEEGATGHKDGRDGGSVFGEIEAAGEGAGAQGGEDEVERGEESDGEWDGDAEDAEEDVGQIVDRALAVGEEGEAESLIGVPSGGPAGRPAFEDEGAPGEGLEGAVGVEDVEIGARGGVVGVGPDLGAEGVTAQ